jgi:hypothetical protein
MRPKSRCAKSFSEDPKIRLRIRLRIRRDRARGRCSSTDPTRWAGFHSKDFSMTRILPCSRGKHAIAANLHSISDRRHPFVSSRSRFPCSLSAARYSPHARARTMPWHQPSLVAPSLVAARLPEFREPVLLCDASCQLA